MPPEVPDSQKPSSLSIISSTATAVTRQPQLHVAFVVTISFDSKTQLYSFDILITLHC